MWRRLLSLVLPVLVVSAVGASAASGPDRVTRTQHSLPGPAVTASSSLRLPDLKRCVRRTFIRVGLVPPPDVTFASLSVRVGADEILQLASLGGPGSVVVSLPAGKSRVRVSGTTSDGQFLAAAKTYARCRRRAPVKTPVATPTPPKPKPKPRPVPTPNVQGGGED
jgi:hypothetical protein